MNISSRLEFHRIKRSVDDFKAYGLLSGVGMVMRKMGSSVSPVVELTEKDGVYILKTSSAFKNTEIKFKLDEEFDEETVDGRKVKSICTLEGNKLVQVQKGEKGSTIEREFGPTEMKAVRDFRRLLELIIYFSNASLAIKMIKIKYLYDLYYNEYKKYLYRRDIF